LAVHLGINPNTIQRAYRELKAEGYLYALLGKGWFVSRKQDMGIMGDKRRDSLLTTFDETTRELQYLGLDKQSLLQRLDSIKV